MKKVLLILAVLLIPAATFAGEKTTPTGNKPASASAKKGKVKEKCVIPKLEHEEKLPSGETVTIKDCDCARKKAKKLDFKDVLYVPKNCIIDYVLEAQGIVLKSKKYSFNKKADLQGSLASYLYQTDIPFRFILYQLSKIKDGPELRFFIFHDPYFEEESGDFYPFWDGKNWAWKHALTGEIRSQGKRDKNGVPEGHPDYLKD